MFTPPLPQFWMAAPRISSAPWNFRRPVMTRLEMPAAVMLEVESWAWLLW